MAHHLANVNVRHRLTQIVIMVILILAGVLFSQVVNAQHSNQQVRLDKPKYRVKVHSSAGKVCYILFKKRTAVPHHSLLAFNRRNKQTPMAETDEPARLSRAN